MNEAETRLHLIDPILREKGYLDGRWQLRAERPLSVEPTGNKGQRKKGIKPCDYLLCVWLDGMPKALPVGLIEAKAENADPMKGMQQAKGYAADCERLHVPYVFSSNGHRYAEFDRITEVLSGAFPLHDFPTHQALTERYALATGIDLTQPAAQLLFMEDSKAYGSKPRYYQDAAIRAAFEKILHCQQSGEAARVLLSLATGAGKTIIATNLLWRLSQAGQLAKPALFLCDRDELRSQAYDKLKAAFGDNARMVQLERGTNAAKNARVHIATYQTLGLDDDDKQTESFLTRHYADNAFSVILIDECHRSAWGRWSEILKRNPEAIHIGLTATPRQLHENKHSKEDAEITANNHQYFGEPVYEYSLLQAQEDGWLAACEVVERKVRDDDKTLKQAEVLEAKPVELRTGMAVSEDDVKPEYANTHFERDLFQPKRIAAMCKDLFQQLCLHGGAEQKVIIFCASDAHADRVAQQMGNLYSAWCKEQKRTPKADYAFKCTNTYGSDLIEPMRGSGERCFIACTVDLLATGVDIERLNAVVFFRYLQSSILFYQMVGRGTRIHEATHKYKFWLYDYTGVTKLFGTDFITRAPSSGSSSGGGGNAPPIIEVTDGKDIQIDAVGNFIIMQRDGRDTKVPLEEYRAAMMERVIREANTLEDFRQLWVEKTRRRELIDHLLGENYSPSSLREQLPEVGDCDDFDVFAHYAYHTTLLPRQARADLYLHRQQAWFNSVNPKAAAVLRGLGHQFSVGGTEALESDYLWQVPEIRLAGGIDTLRSVGNPIELFHEAKRRLFGG